MQTSPGTPRASVAETVRLLEQKVLALRCRLDRQPTLDDLAYGMGVKLEEYLFILEELYPLPIFDQKDFQRDAQGIPSPMRDDELGSACNLADAFIVKVLAQGIEALPDKERLIVTLHYHEKMPPEEIALVLSLSPSSVTQLHSQAIIRLRADISKVCAAISTTLQ